MLRCKNFDLCERKKALWLKVRCNTVDGRCEQADKAGKVHEVRKKPMKKVQSIVLITLFP